MSDLSYMKKSSLGEIASVVMGQSPDSKYYSGDQSHEPFLQGCADFGQSFPNAKIYCSAGNKFANAGDLLFSVRAPVGRLNRADQRYVIGRGLAAICAIGVDQGFLEQNLIFQSHSFRTASQGSTFEAINSTELKNWSLDHPKSLPEQTKIAEILSTVDRAIEQTEALIAKQQRIKTGLMADLLTRGIDADGNLRSEATHAFKDSPLGRIPVEWEVKELGEVGNWYSGGTPSRTNSSFWGQDVPWLCPKDMKVFDISSTIENLTELGLKNGSRLLPPESVFIVVRGMILAHTFPVCISDRAMALNQDVKGIVAAPEVNPRFLAFWLNQHGQSLLRITTTATHGTKRFDMDELSVVPIGLPEYEEQKGIVRVIDTAEALEQKYSHQLNKLRAQKTALMQDLLTGRKRVTDLLKD